MYQDEHDDDLPNFNAPVLQDPTIKLASPFDRLRASDTPEKLSNNDTSHIFGNNFVEASSYLLEQQRNLSTEPKNIQQHKTQVGSPLTANPYDDPDYDFSALMEIEELFKSTEAAMPPPKPHPFVVPSLPANHGYRLITDPVSHDVLGMEKRTAESILQLDLTEGGRRYLENEGCFTIPTSDVLQTMAQSYFRYIHPNLPVVSEENFGVLCYSESGLGSLPFLVVQAMMFAAVSVSCHTCKMMTNDANETLGLGRKRYSCSRICNQT